MAIRREIERQCVKITFQKTVPAGTEALGAVGDRPRQRGDPEEALVVDLRARDRRDLAMHRAWYHIPRKRSFFLD